TELLAGLIDVISRQSAPLAAFFLERGADGKLGDPQLIGGSLRGATLGELVAVGADNAASPPAMSADNAEAGSRVDSPPALDRLARQVSSAARNACRAGEIELRRHALPALIAVAAPVPRRGFEPHACGAIFPPAESPSQLALLWQLLVAHFVLWETLQSNARRASIEPESPPAVSPTAASHSGEPNGTRLASHVPPADTAARDSDATIELMERVLAAATTREASQALCEALREHFGCDRVLIGTRANDQSPCRLAAISQVARFDRRGESIRLMEAAMNEALLRGGMAVWPARDETDRHALLAHKSLANSEHAAAVLSVPLQSGAASGKAHGVVTLTFAGRIERQSQTSELIASSNPERPNAPISDAARLLAVAAPSLAIALESVRHREGGIVSRTWKTFQRSLTGWRNVALAGAALIGVCAMSVPWPYRVPCECRVEPAVRRFVVAPYDGVLERVFAKPGDIVEEGQLLARLEDRALRLERPTIEAELHQAAKKRDVALAKNDSSARQIAELEIRQFASKLRLLDDRAEHLELLSPVKGVIASGDLERAEGATLEEGQSLFEVVLLDRMIVEIAVPDDEVSHVRPGQSVDIRLDAYPGRAWAAPLERIQPRAEIREEENVFVAEIELENVDERLRPGMKGRAKVATDRRPLGWILFHKPWEYVVKRLAW
ncbi:MAG: efflux RND transporter periplasmic adaptor subunit, partial [Planctomycetota bacterium]